MLDRFAKALAELDAALNQFEKKEPTTKEKNERTFLSCGSYGQLRVDHKNTL